MIHIRCSGNRSRLTVCNVVIIVTGTVKKCGMLKILHEKYKHSKKATSTVLSDFVHSFDEAVEYNKEIEPLLSKTQVSDSHCGLLP